MDMPASLSTAASRFALRLACASFAIALGVDHAHAQWSVPYFLYPGQGVTATGDGYLQFATTNTVVTGGINPNPKLFWPTGGTEYTVVAMEFSGAVLVQPELGCPEIPKRLRIPIDSFTPATDVFLGVASYVGTANGIIDAADLTTWQVGADLEPSIGTIHLQAGQTYTSLEIDVNAMERPFTGFFLYRLDAADTQVISIHNGGATLLYPSVVSGCATNSQFTPPAVCFQDFGGGRWVLLEFIDSAYDWSLGQYAVGGQVIDTDWDTGYALGCSITEYTGGVVPGTTDFAPVTSGVNLAAYEIGANTSVPVGPSNRVRVSIGYQAFTTERTKEQQLQLYHGPNGSSFVAVSDEFWSNRGGNDDGGWVSSVARESLSPWVLAFAEERPDRSCEVVPGAFEAPMGATRNVGATMPLKLGLALDGAVLDSEAALAEVGLGAPSARVYDVTGGGASFVAEVLLGAEGGRWVAPLHLARATFAAGRTYEVRVAIGSCELVPPNALFRTR